MTHSLEWVNGGNLTELMYISRNIIIKTCNPLQCVYNDTTLSEWLERRLIYAGIKRCFDEKTKIKVEWFRQGLHCLLKLVIVFIKHYAHNR